MVKSSDGQKHRQAGPFLAWMHEPSWNQPGYKPQEYVTMPDKKPGGLKLKLRKADTNRLKTQTGRLKTEGAEDASEAQTKAVPIPPAPVAPPPSQTAEIRDPMALRDTSQGKLKRVQSPDETAKAIAPPADGEQGVKRETVRLKVVRDKKKGGPQILPPTPQAAPAPPPAADTAPPAAQTVKISLPGLKKSGTPSAATKKATSTVRIQEPPAEQAGGTLKVAPPEPDGTEEDFRETSTATLKLNAQKPAPGTPDASRTVKIKPGPGLTKPQEDSEGDDQNKRVTATLKIKPSQDKPTAPTPEPVAPPESSNKNITATLKIKSGDQPSADSGATVKITPPQPEDKAGADTVVAPPSPSEDKPAGKPGLKLRKPGKPAAADDAAATVRLPGIEETPAPAAEDASETVALPTGDELAPDEEPAEGGKKGLKLRTAGKSAEAEPSAEGEPGEEGEEAPEVEPAALAPRPKSSGPGVFAFVSTLAACGGLGALVYRLVMDFLQHIK